jgi:hypothetical protein
LLAGNRLLHALKIADVKCKRCGLLATRANCVGRLFDFFRCSCGQRDMRAGVGQGGGCREPYAAPGTGHQRPLAVEPE